MLMNGHSTFKLRINNKILAIISKSLSLNEFESVFWGRYLQYKILKMEKLTEENSKSIGEKMKTCDRRQASFVEKRHSCRGKE